uniref:Uncharacterized protein n=1 Tax=Timema douglasi TaxID=61478 RepID=A0A7R8ZDK9_TIMDO|nr:unnamed protein product [Timema douglasi]
MCGDRMVVINDKQDAGIKRVAYLSPSWARLCEVWDLIDVAVDQRDMWLIPIARYCNDLIDTLVVDVCDELTDVVDLEQPRVETHIKNLDLIRPTYWRQGKPRLPRSRSILVLTCLVDPPDWHQGCDTYLYGGGGLKDMIDSRSSRKGRRRTDVPTRVEHMSKELLEVTLRKKKECNTKALLIVERLLEETVSKDWLLDCVSE